MSPSRMPKPNRLATRLYRQKHRQKVLLALGGECVQCGNDDFRALQIDHKNGGGKEHRRRLPSPYAYLCSVLADLGSFQALCANCHAIKSYDEATKRRIAA